MKLYKVTAKFYDYDEYDEFIIWAKTEDEAKQLAIEKTSCEKYAEDGNGGWVMVGYVSNFYDADVEELNIPTEPQILSGSFNAG